MREAGVRPGPDIAVVGFDGHEMADVFDLSTISQPLEQLGVAAARNILADLSTRDCAREAAVLPTELIVRGSSMAHAN